jgi:pimeloyl-ACP methyl ester carboxylesterase
MLIKKSSKKRRRLNTNPIFKKVNLFFSELFKKIKTKKRLIKILIILSVILIVLLLFLRIKFFLGEPLHFRLTPKEVNLYSNNNETIYQEFTINVDNFPTCSSFCSFSLYDINNGSNLFIENFSISFRKVLKENLSFSTPVFGEGILLYRYDIICTNNPSIFCPSTGENHYQSTFIKIEYELNSSQKELKSDLKLRVMNLTSITNANYLIFNHLVGLENNYKKVKEKIPVSFSQSLDDNFYSLRQNKGLLQDLIDESFNFIDLWNQGDYHFLNSNFNSTYVSSLFLFNDLNNLKFNITFIIDSLNSGNMIILDFNSLKPVLNNAFNFYSSKSNYFSESKNIFDFYNYRINAQLLRDLEIDILDNIDDSGNFSIFEYNSHTIKINNISRLLLTEYKKDLKNFTNPLYGEVLILNSNLDYLFNDSISKISNNSILKISKIPILVSDEFLSKNTPYDFSYFCSFLTDTNKKITALNKTYFNISYISINQSNTSITNNTNKSSISNTDNFSMIKSTTLNSKLNNLVSYYNFSLLLNNSNISFLNLMNSLELYQDLTCDISSSTTTFFNPININNFNYTIPTQTNTIASLSFNIENNTKSCCVMDKCNPCNSSPDNQSLYPVIFVHGHMFNSALSPESPLKAFNLIANELENYGYINTGDFDLALFYEDNLVNEWSEFTHPVLTRVSYYYINYFDLGISTLQTQKSERIENYALRLNEFITAILKKTNKEKVNLVTHSMGGLVSREYINIFGEDKVSKLITISTPHQGILGRVYSVCKLTGSSKECEDMHSDSAFLKRLNQPSNIPEKIEIHTIGGYGCEMQTDSGVVSGDGVVIYNHSQLSYAQNYKIKGNCTDIFQSDLHLKILDPSLYPQVPILIDSILRN